MNILVNCKYITSYFIKKVTRVNTSSLTFVIFSLSSDVIENRGPQIT